MARVEWDMPSELPPERIIDALLDFTETRPDQWEGLSREFYEVYSVGETSAEIKEGTKAFPMSVWARERYDWSTPGTIQWIVQDSNLLQPGYGVTATITARGTGSNVHVVWERFPKNLKAKLVIAMLAARDGKAIKKLVKKSFDSLPKEAPRKA